MSTPKYCSIVNTENDSDLLFYEHPTIEQPTLQEFDAYINAEVTRISEDLELGKTLVELYIRERDTRRQFSPEQLATLHDKIQADLDMNMTSAQRFAKQIDIVLEEYRKLIHEP